MKTIEIVKRFGNDKWDKKWDLFVRIYQLVDRRIYLPIVNEIANRAIKADCL